MIVLLVVVNIGEVKYGCFEYAALHNEYSSVLVFVITTY